MDLIWGHIAPEAMSCPELKNIGLTLWVIQKTSVWFSRHVDSDVVVLVLFIPASIVINCEIFWKMICGMVPQARQK